MSSQRWLALGGAVLLIGATLVFFFMNEEGTELTEQEAPLETGSEGEEKLSVMLAPDMTYPPTVYLNGPSDFLERAKNCVYSPGFSGIGGNGVTIEWGDGSMSPNPEKAISLQGQICEEDMTRHAYAAPGTYVITVHLWHPGPADAMVTDLQEELVVTIP